MGENNVKQLPYVQQTWIGLQNLDLRTAKGEETNYTVKVDIGPSSSHAPG